MTGVECTVGKSDRDLIEPIDRDGGILIGRTNLPAVERFRDVIDGNEQLVDEEL